MSVFVEWWWVVARIECERDTWQCCWIKTMLDRPHFTLLLIVLPLSFKHCFLSSLDHHCKATNNNCIFTLNTDRTKNTSFIALQRRQQGVWVQIACQCCYKWMAGLLHAVSWTSSEHGWGPLREGTAALLHRLSHSSVLLCPLCTVSPLEWNVPQCKGHIFRSVHCIYEWVKGHVQHIVWLILSLKVLSRDSCQDTSVDFHNCYKQHTRKEI